MVRIVASLVGCLLFFIDFTVAITPCVAFFFANLLPVHLGRLRALQIKTTTPLRYKVASCVIILRSSVD